MSYDVNDEDVVSVEVINPSVSEHKTDYVSNVIYTSQSNNKKKTAKKAQARNNDAFYKWVKGLNPDTDGIKTQTQNFEYSRYTVDGKKKAND